MNDCYVDDVHYGTDRIKQAVIGREELLSAMKPSGLSLRKWASNSDEIISDLTANMVDTNETQRFMGLLWNRAIDEISYPFIDCGSEVSITKRQLLTHVAKIYDPMGWAQPIVITAK